MLKFSITMRIIPELKSSSTIPELSFVRLEIPEEQVYDSSWSQKIVDFEDLHDFMDWTTHGLPWAYIIGCFDDEFIHPGHLALITSLKILYGIPTAVAIENTRTIQNNKGGLFRPYAKDERRLQKLAQRPEIDAVTLFTDTLFYGTPDHQSQRTVIRRMEKTQPPIILIDTQDPYSPYPYSQNSLAEYMGIKRILFERVHNYSTTRTRGY